MKQKQTSEPARPFLRIVEQIEKTGGYIVELMDGTRLAVSPHDRTLRLCWCAGGLTAAVAKLPDHFAPPCRPVLLALDLGQAADRSSRSCCLLFARPGGDKSADGLAPGRTAGRPLCWNPRERYS